MTNPELEQLTMNDLKVAFYNPASFRFSSHTLDYIHQLGTACVISMKVKDPVQARRILQNSFPGLSNQQAEYQICLSQDYVIAIERAGKRN